MNHNPQEIQQIKSVYIDIARSAMEKHEAPDVRRLLETPEDLIEKGLATSERYADRRARNKGDDVTGIIRAFAHLQAWTGERPEGVSSTNWRYRANARAVGYGDELLSYLGLGHLKPSIEDLPEYYEPGSPWRPENQAPSTRQITT